MYIPRQMGPRAWRRQLEGCSITELLRASCMRVRAAKAEYTGHRRKPVGPQEKTKCAIRTNALRVP